MADELEPDFKNLDDVTRKVRLALEQGFTPKQIKGFLRKKGYTPKSWHKVATRRYNKLMEAHESPLLSAIFGVGEDILSGMTFGLSDHLMAYLQALTGPEESSEEALATMRALRKGRATGWQSELLGAMVSGTGLTKAAYKLAPVLKPKAGAPVVGYAKEALVDVTLGAGEASASAALAGGDAEAVKQAALIGGGAGLLSPAVSRAANLGGGAVRAALRKLPGVDDPAAQERARQAISTRITDQDVSSTGELREGLQAYEDVGMGEQARLAYVGGPNLQQLGKTAIIVPGPAQAKAKQALLADQRANSEHVKRYLAGGLGYADKGSTALRDQIEKTMKQRAAPLYDQAFGDLSKLKHEEFTDKNIDAIMRLPEFRAAYKRAAYNARHATPSVTLPPFPLEVKYKMRFKMVKDAKGNPRHVIDKDGNKVKEFVLDKAQNKILLPQKPPKWTIYALDKVKKAINAKVKTPIISDKAIERDLAASLIERNQVLVNRLDRHSPVYGEARKIWSEGSGNRDAFDLGGDAYGSKSADLVEAEFKALETEAERELYRIGAATQAVTKIDRSAQKTQAVSALFESPEAIKKHEILFKDEHASGQFIERLRLLSQIKEGAGAMIPRSDTAGNLLGAADAATELATKVGPGFTRRAVDWAGGKLGGEFIQARNRATNREIGGLLFDPGAEQARATLGAIDEDARRLSSKLVRQGLLSGALTSGAAHMLGSSTGAQ